MGRRKINISYINDPRVRKVTFSKRMNGVMKKAYELSVLCGCEVALILIHDQRISQFSTLDVEKFMETYNKLLCAGSSIDRRTPTDMAGSFSSRNHPLIDVHSDDGSNENLRSDSPDRESNAPKTSRKNFGNDVDAFFHYISPDDQRSINSTSKNVDYCNEYPYRYSTTKKDSQIPNLRFSSGSYGQGLSHGLQEQSNHSLIDESAEVSSSLCRNSPNLYSSTQGALYSPNNIYSTHLSQAFRHEAQSLSYRNNYSNSSNSFQNLPLYGQSENIDSQSGISQQSSIYFQHGNSGRDSNMPRNHQHRHGNLAYSPSVSHDQSGAFRQIPSNINQHGRLHPGNSKSPTLMQSSSLVGPSDNRNIQYDYFPHSGDSRLSPMELYTRNFHSPGQPFQSIDPRVDTDNSGTRQINSRGMHHPINNALMQNTHNSGGFRSPNDIRGGNIFTTASSPQGMFVVRSPENLHSSGPHYAEENQKNTEKNLQYHFAERSDSASPDAASSRIDEPHDISEPTDLSKTKSNSSYEK